MYLNCIYRYLSLGEDVSYSPVVRIIIIPSDSPAGRLQLSRWWQLSQIAASQPQAKGGPEGDGGENL